MSITKLVRQNPLTKVDLLIDGVTMYLLLEIVLFALLLIAAGLSAIGVIGYNPIAIILSAAYLAVVCRITNTVFAYVFETPSNKESTLITALILALLITPVASLHSALFLTAAGGLAVASKYIIAVHKKHLFNPAAIALVLLYFAAGDTAGWWVGNIWLTPFVVAGGLLIVRKIRRMRMVLVFIIAALISTAVMTVVGHGNIGTNITVLLQHSSLFFLGFIMLTEPLTSPSASARRYQYASLVGVLFPPQIHLFTVYSTPELALVIGNLWSYLVSPKVKILPVLQQKIRLAPDIIDFRLSREPAYTYVPGQYAEMTIAYPHSDNRGNRRMITLASSPTENSLHFGIKFYDNGSSFKKALAVADKHASISISPPAGDFILPKDSNQKLAFIAGGIGVTPYRSMMKYLIDRSERRDICMIYAEKRPEELVYTDIFDDAKSKLGARITYTVQEPGTLKWRGRTGYITKKMISDEIPDFAVRLFYVSGPLNMVTAVKNEIRALGVPAHRIKTDYFPGYA